MWHDNDLRTLLILFEEHKIYLWRVHLAEMRNIDVKAVHDFCVVRANENICLFGLSRLSIGVRLPYSERQACSTSSVIQATRGHLSLLASYKILNTAPLRTCEVRFCWIIMIKALLLGSYKVESCAVGRLSDLGKCPVVLEHLGNALILILVLLESHSHILGTL